MFRFFVVSMVAAGLGGCAEADPIFQDAPAAAVTEADVTRWNQAHAWGDHADAGYLATETDPAFALSPAASVTVTDLASWDDAVGWGDHRQVGYLTAEADPAFAASPASTIDGADLTAWDTAAGWGDHAQAGYLTTETDPLFASSPAGGISAGQVARWEEASAWGDHRAGGYAAASALVWRQVGTQAWAYADGENASTAARAELLNIPYNGQFIGRFARAVWQSFSFPQDRVLGRVVIQLRAPAVETVVIREGEGLAGPVLYSTPANDPQNVDIQLVLPLVGGRTYTVSFERAEPTSFSLYTNLETNYPGGRGGVDEGAVGRDLVLQLWGVSPVVVTQDARVGIGTEAPSAPLDVSGDTVRVRTPRTPVSATAPCQTGEQSWDTNYVYVCVATNTWRRAALSSW